MSFNNFVLFYARSTNEYAIGFDAEKKLDKYTKCQCETHFGWKTGEILFRGSKAECRSRASRLANADDMSLWSGTIEKGTSRAHEKINNASFSSKSQSEEAVSKEKELKRKRGEETSETRASIDSKAQRSKLTKKLR